MRIVSLCSGIGGLAHPIPMLYGYSHADHRGSSERDHRHDEERDHLHAPHPQGGVTRRARFDAGRAAQVPNRGVARPVRRGSEVWACCHATLTGGSSLPGPTSEQTGAATEGVPDRTGRPSPVALLRRGHDPSGGRHPSRSDSEGRLQHHAASRHPSPCCRQAGSARPHESHVEGRRRQVRSPTPTGGGRTREAVGLRCVRHDRVSEVRVGESHWRLRQRERLRPSLRPVPQTDGRCTTTGPRPDDDARLTSGGRS